MLLAPASAGQTWAQRPTAAAPPLRRLLLAARCGRVCTPRCTGGAPPPRPGATTHIPARRKCSPLLESALLSPGGNEPAANKWKAVPDTWRTAARKYPDSVALVDPYHDPPTELTYKQLEQQILDFSHGLRAAGVAPDEKLSLFADNSCRWLVAVQATGLG